MFTKLQSKMQAMLTATQRNSHLFLEILAVWGESHAHKDAQGQRPC
jgi:hypothetical protein